MKWLRNLAVLALAFILTNSAEAAGKAKKKAKPFKGTVVEVKKDADKETGTVVVSIAGKKKTNTPATEKTIKVTTNTKILKAVAAGKKAKDAAAAPTASKLSELEKGGKVTITAKDDEASQIQFVAKKKKKSK